VARFSKTIKAKYNFETYEGTKQTVDWILFSLKKLKLSWQKPKVSFLFDIGDVECSCEGLDDFIQTAYGQSGYCLIKLEVVQFSKTDVCAYISSFNNGNLHVSTKDKKTLESIVTCLDETNYEDINGDTTKKHSSLHQWAIAILQNILANWIWIIIASVFTSLFAFFVKK